ncbi:TetR/AcrR family transcriptional regulator [Flavobacteriaceae bacterium]|nr:TetR/AcrR family transcriptional regulator [Flavobacteriaceae bacterium]
MSKKENILTAALDLFAKQGVAASSTRAIALQSGVSEGLIFRHFANKEALLTEVLKKESHKSKTALKQFYIRNTLK